VLIATPEPLLPKFLNWVVNISLDAGALLSAARNASVIIEPVPPASFLIATRAS